MVIKLIKITSQSVENSKVLVIINCLSQMTGKLLREDWEAIWYREIQSELKINLLSLEEQLEKLPKGLRSHRNCL